MHYYETGTDHETQAHATIEEAIAFADENNCEIICEIGGNWEEWRKCWFCDDWMPTSEFSRNATVCHRCEIAIADHEGY